jgi:hypothetical protein
MLARTLASSITLVAIVASAATVSAQDRPQLSLDSLLQAHQHVVTLEGTRAGGPGFDLLLESASAAQFFIIAEEHNLLELNEFTVALFDELQARLDFQHLALEQGSVITSWIDAAARSGGRDSVDAIVRAYPHAPTFATDEEFALMAHVRQKSTADGPAVWGVDQELGALHLLERLAELSSSSEAQAEFRRLAEEARPYEETRTGDVHYLYSVANPEEYHALGELAASMDDPEQRSLLAALQRTVRIYTGRREPLGEYESGREREHSTRARFMEHYPTSIPHAAPPKVIVKMGHWHTLPGFYRSNVPTFGNFLTELAAANGMGSVVVSTYVVGSPDSWRNSGGAIGRVGDPDGISVIDLRPLRPIAHKNGIAELADGWRDLIFQADFVLVIGGGRTGSYSTAYGSN